MKSSSASEVATSARCVGAFFDELSRWAVRDVVVSPGSRSTPLAMVAYELARREPDRLRITLDVDERGAAFYALGAAKATGRPAAFICTSGTAAANAHPAVMEAAGSRVPLLVLTGDRPPRLQELGAPQTADQLKLYGDAVKAFRAMPVPDERPATVAFFRQAAREAVIAATGGALSAAQTWDTSPVIAARGSAAAAGPVQLNFPFDEPLTPDLAAENVFSTERAPEPSTPIAPLPPVAGELPLETQRSLEALLANHRTLLLAGEGSCETEDEAAIVLGLAERLALPVLADPLSGLRSFDNPVIVDAYDRICAGDDWPAPELVLRFGRWPISKAATLAIEAAHPLQIVVDAAQTRDFLSQTTAFVAMRPVDFALTLWETNPTARQDDYLEAWRTANDHARQELDELIATGVAVEGAYVARLLECAPLGSLLFAANSMAVRAIDSFYAKRSRPLAVIGNRAVNGIDGTISSACGAATAFRQTTLLIGDLAMLHDLNALALQRELLNRPNPPSIVIVLMNNNGGAIFDMLPQASDDPYFERLFLTPQDVAFAQAAAAFDVPVRRVETPEEFEEAYEDQLGVPGLSLIEITLPLRGLAHRYGRD